MRNMDTYGALGFKMPCEYKYVYKEKGGSCGLLK